MAETLRLRIYNKLPRYTYMYILQSIYIPYTLHFILYYPISQDPVISQSEFHVKLPRWICKIWKGSLHHPQWKGHRHHAEIARNTYSFIPPWKLTMENPPWMKMYFLLNMEFFLVFRGKHLFNWTVRIVTSSPEPSMTIFHIWKFQTHVRNKVRVVRTNHLHSGKLTKSLAGKWTLR